MKYRLYIDETGNPDLASSDNPNHRFLSLTGIAIELGYVELTVFPELEQLKSKYFKSHPDEPVILHRKEMVNQKHSFEILGDEKVRAVFDSELLNLLRNWDYTVFTVILDKLEHKQKYTTWRFDPYHYCLTVMVERFVLFLEDKCIKGDVMAESRGGNDDRRLKDSFELLLKNGTEYITPERFANSLTSRQLKIKPKSNNIAGLQLADILAHPSRKELLNDYKLLEVNFENSFAKEVIGILRNKYYQKAGQIDGYGKKKLP